MCGDFQSSLREFYLTLINKHYLVDRQESPYGPLFGPLPIPLLKPGDRGQVLVDIADDLDRAAQDGVLKGVTLRLLIEQLTARDTLEFELNGKLLNAESARKRLLYNDCWLDFDVLPPLLKQGWPSKRNPPASIPNSWAIPMVVSPTCLGLKIIQPAAGK